MDLETGLNINEMAEMILDLTVQIEALTSVLVQKGLMSENDIKACETYLKSTKFKTTYDVSSKTANRLKKEISEEQAEEKRINNINDIFKKPFNGQKLSETEKNMMLRALSKNEAEYNYSKAKQAGKGEKS